MDERLELHRRMAGVVETSWSLGDIDRAITGPASTTRSPRARLSVHGRARGLVKMYGSGHAPALENVFF